MAWWINSEQGGLIGDQFAALDVALGCVHAASNPGDPVNPVTWPRWVRLMPHLLYAGLAGTNRPALRQLACDACAYLLARRDRRTCYDLASDLHRQRRGRLGDDHQHVRAIALYLAWRSGGWAATPKRAT